MLNKIIFFSIKNKLLIGLFVSILIGYGAFQVTRLPIDAVPDITNNQVQVITVAPSYGATDIERLVTFPVEQANSNIPGLIEIRSFSRFGLSLVTIVFDDATDIYWARQQVAERLQLVRDQIPKDIGTPELGPVTTGLGEIYQYVVRPQKGFEKKYSPIELRTIQDWYVRRQLLGVRGVAEVSSFGGKLKQYVISIDPNKLKSFSLSIGEIFKALEANNQNTGGAYIEKGPTVLNINSEGLIENINDIKDILIRLTKGGSPIHIRDVADVKIGFATRYGALCYNDKGEVAGGIVMMLKGGNSNEVINNVKSRIEQIQKTLPKGVVIEPFLDRTKMVNNAIGTVETNLMEGALIVVFVLVLFLGNIRAGLLVASIIPLSMLFAIIMMNYFGVSGNLMSLGALDFGLIVDGAVIIVEAVMHQLMHNKKFEGVMEIPGSEMDSEVNQSASKMMNSAVFGQIIILIVYLPIFTLQGIEGKMFKPMAQTVAFALLGAFLLSITYIPMMSSLLLRKRTGKKMNFSDRMIEAITSVYKKWLNRLIRYPKTILSIVVLLFISALLILMNIGGEFIPALEEGDFAVETRLLTGSNLNTSIENTQKAARIILEKFPEVEKVVTKIGSGEVPTDPMPMEAADLMIILKDKKEWTSAKTFNELAEKMGEEMQNVPGLTFGFQFPVQMRFNELMTGAKQDVVCKIFGENLDTLSAYAKKMGTIINSIEGAHELYIESVVGMPQVIIKYDRSKLSQFGLTISDINKTVNASFAGQKAGLVYEGEKRFDLVVRLEAEKRSSLDDIRNLLIPVHDNVQVPLYQLADVYIIDGPNQIQREDAKRRIIIGFNVRGRDVQSIVTELQGKVNKKIKFPVGYYPTYGGAFENLNAAKKRLSIAVPVSLILIFALLYFAFNSIRQGLLIYTAIPLSAIGGVFALFLRGMPFSISAGIGFIALFGVAVLNGIVLISEFNRLKNDGEEDVMQIISKGTQMRLRPVLMTALVASLGFLPMALSNGAGAEVQRPLATVVIGGLMVATFLTLFVLPILYMLIHRNDKTRIKSVKVGSIIFALLMAGSMHSQKTISFSEAVELAKKNNLQLKNQKLRSEFQKELISSGVNIPNTQVSIGYGQINSVYYDNQINLAQSFNFPTVYKNQKQLLNEQWIQSVTGITQKEAEIKRNLAGLYYHYGYLISKEKLLLQSDSIYSAFVKKASERYEKGETDVVEKASTEVYQGQLRLQLNQVKQEIELSILEFKLMLNMDEDIIPEMPDMNADLIVSLDSNLLMKSFFVQQLEQQRKMSGINLKLEKSKMLPDITMSYNNMTMRGVGADNMLYGLSNRFQSAQLGLGIPLFFGSAKSRIASARKNILISDSEYELGLKQLRMDYSMAVKQYEKSLTERKYFIESALKNADMIAKVADKRYKAGEINYMEWSILMNQSILIQSDYIECLRRLNESVITINYLQNK